MTEHSITTPSWLNEEFIKTVIISENDNSDGAVITKYHIAPAAAPGDNYISDIYRISVKTRDARELSLIVKCLPTAEFNLKFIRTARLYEKEIFFYDTVIPLMCKLEKCELRMVPKCYFMRPYSVIVLDDLTRQGFKSGDRRKGLDLDHCKEALKSLARFHALSTSLPQEMMVSNFRDTVYSGAGQDHARSYVMNCVLSVAERVEKWPGYERFAEKLRKIASTSSDRVVYLFETDFPFRVLNHGDFWTNNIMFQHTKSGHISGIRIIDFQMCRFVSPVFDILYFLYTSPQEDIRLNHRHSLLEEYCEEFTNTARRLNLPARISVDELAKAMEENEFFGFINAIMMLPAVLYEPEKTPDLENVAQGKSEMEWVSGERFRQQFQKILDDFEEKGRI